MQVKTDSFNSKIQANNRIVLCKNSENSIT